MVIRVFSLESVTVLQLGGVVLGGHVVDPCFSVPSG